jgi:hypothetical protein
LYNTWQITQLNAKVADFSTTQILVPSSDAGIFNLTVSATDRYGPLSSESAKNFSIQITPQAGGVNITSTDFDLIAKGLTAALSNSLQIQENGSFQFPNIDSTISLLTQHLDHPGGAEKLGIQLTLKGHWTVSGFGTNVFNASPADGSQLVLNIFDTSSSSISAAISNLKLIPPNNFFGSVDLNIQVGSYLVAQANQNTNHLPLASQFTLTPLTSDGTSLVLNNTITVKPVSYAPNLSIDGNPINKEAITLSHWDATTQLNAKSGNDYVIPLSTLKIQVTKTEVDTNPEDQFIEINKNDLSSFGGKLVDHVSHQELSPISINEQSWYRIPVADLTRTDIQIPVLNSQGIPNTSDVSFKLQGASSNQGAADALGTATTLTLPLTSLPPQIPTLSILNPTGLLEGQSIVLSQLVSMTPALGRTTDGLSALIKVGNVGEIAATSNGSLVHGLLLLDSAGHSPAVVTLNGVSYFEVAHADLGKYSIVPSSGSAMQFFYGNVGGIQVIAQDASGAGSSVIADSAPQTLSVNYAPIASGIDKNLFKTTPALSLNLGLLNTIYDPLDPSKSIFSKIKVINSAEDYNTSVVFKGVSSNQVEVKVGEVYVTGVSDSAGNVSFTFTKAQITGGAPITVKPDVSLYSTNGSSSQLSAMLNVQTFNGPLDNRVASTVLSQDLSLSTHVLAQAPTINIVSKIAAQEDQVFDLKIDCTLDAAYAGLEKFGLRISSEDPGLEGTIFHLAGKDYEYHVGSTLQILDTSTQLDFSKLTATAPLHYKGDAVFAIQSIAQANASGFQAISDPIITTVHVAPSAGVISQANHISSISGIQGGNVSLDISSYLNVSQNPDPLEKVSISITIPKGVTLTHQDAQNHYSLVTGGVQDASLAFTTYRLPDILESNLVQQLSGYQLQFDDTYSTTAQDGSRLDSQIKVQANTINVNSSGEETVIGLPITIQIPLSVKPIAHLPSAPTLRGEIPASLNESSSLTGPADGLQKLKVMNFISIPATDNSISEKLQIKVEASKYFVLEISSDEISFSQLLPDAPIGSNATGVYTLSPEQYASLYIQSTPFFNSLKDSGNPLSLKVLTQHVPSWGDGAAVTSNAQEFNLLVNPVPFGPVAAPQVSALTANEDSSNLHSLRDFISSDPSLVDTSQNSTETLYYRVKLPANNVSLITSDKHVVDGTNVGPDKKIYTLKAADLDDYLVQPGVNFAGTIDITFEAFTQEPDLLTRSSYLKAETKFTITPVSHTPILKINKTAVDADPILIDGGSTTPLPIVAQVATIDATQETLTVKITVSGLSNASDVKFSLGGQPITLLPENDHFYFKISGSNVQKLPYLTVSSTKFFGVNSLNQDTSLTLKVDASSQSKLVDSSTSTLPEPADSIGTVKLSIDPSKPYASNATDGIKLDIDNASAINSPAHLTALFQKVLDGSNPSQPSTFK